MTTAPAKKAKAGPRLKYLAMRVNDAEHKKFNKAAKSHGGAASVLRHLVEQFLNGTIAIAK